jgi:hypothetical protein
MGRSVSDDPRAHRMTLRFTASELLATKEAAAAAGMSLSDWVRSRAMDRRAAAKAAAAAGGSGRKRSGKAGTADRGGPPKPLLDPAVYHELRHQGVNLNQIAHRMNTQDMLPPPELYALLEDIRRLIRVPVSKPDHDMPSPPVAPDAVSPGPSSGAPGDGA